MNPYNTYTDDLYDGDDPILTHEYHQDLQGGFRRSYSSTGVYISVFLCCLPLVYHLLYAFNYDVPSLPQLLFDTIVYLTPSQLLYSIEKYQQQRSNTPTEVARPRTHVAKGETMRRVLGMDTPGGIISAVGQVGARRLSVFQGLGVARKSEAPMGLGNYDNSCYQNSILQGLASLDSFSKYLESHANGEGDVERQSDSMGIALKDLITDLNDPTNNGKRRWTPSILKNMNSMQQQDAQEYYSGVLDAIEKEKAKGASASMLSKGLEMDDQPRAKSVETQIPISDLRNPLEGMTGQRVSCKSCGHSDGLPLTPFNCLTVPLARVREQDLQTCLDEYTELELIEDMNCVKCTLLKYQSLMSTLVDRTKNATEERLQAACRDAEGRLDSINQALEDDDYEDKTLREKCKIESKQQVKSTKTRQTVIARPSKSLVVHFNRSVFDEYAGRFVKNYSKLWFPETLDLSPWCLGSAGDRTSTTNNVEEWLLNPGQSLVAGTRRQSRFHGPTYRVRGVVTHEGHHEDGHYICYRKQPVEVAEGEKPREQWWRLSDSQVRKAAEEEVFGQKSHEAIFMLFYECIDPEVKWVVPETESTLHVASAMHHEETSQSQLASHVEPTPHPPIAVEDLNSVAANLPLPDDLANECQQSTKERQRTPSLDASTTTTTTASESDIEELSNQDTPYQPAQPIIIAPYVPDSKERSDQHDETTSQQRQRPSVMV